jgi:hypothetical protein
LNRIGFVCRPSTTNKQKVLKRMIHGGNVDANKHETVENM